MTFASFISFPEVLSKTAWQMERPRAYGAFHLCFAIVGLAVCILLAYVLRNLGEKGNRRLLVGIGLTLMLFEAYKLSFFTFCIAPVGQFKWWVFPFQMCSVPMYLCVIAPLIPAGKIRNGMYNFMCTYNLLGGFSALIEPSGLTHEYWTLTVHAFLWHITLVFIGIYLIASGRACRNFKDYLHATLTFLGLSAVAFCINLIFRNVSGGDINMFFVGPSNSSLVVFKDIAANCGWYISTLLYLPTVALGAFLIFLPAHAVVRHIQKKRAGAQPVQP